MAALVRADRHFEELDIVPLADPEAATLLAPLPEDRRMGSLHLLLADGRIRSGGAAVAELARRVPALAPAAAMADRFGLAGRALDRAYRLVAANRGRLSRLVPDAPPVRRRRPSTGL